MSRVEGEEVRRESCCWRTGLFASPPPARPTYRLRVSTDGVDNDPLSSAVMMFPSVCPTRTSHMDEIVIRPEKRPRGRTGAGAKQAGTHTLHATRSPPGRPRGFPSLFTRACGRLAIHLLPGYEGRTRVSTCLLAIATAMYHGS
jgi:hypothetical protein